MADVPDKEVPVHLDSYVAPGGGEKGEGETIKMHSMQRIMFADNEGGSPETSRSSGHGREKVLLAQDSGAMV